MHQRCLLQCESSLEKLETGRKTSAGCVPWLHLVLYFRPNHVRHQLHRPSLPAESNSIICSCGRSPDRRTVSSTCITLRSACYSTRNTKKREGKRRRRKRKQNTAKIKRTRNAKGKGYTSSRVHQRVGSMIMPLLLPLTDLCCGRAGAGPATQRLLL